MSDAAALAPFRIRNFRFQWPGDLLTSWAMEMEALILGWYILVETKSVLLLTLYGALLYLGTLISPMFGVFGDRIGHRNLLSGMRAIYTVLSLVLMTFAFAGALNPVVVLMIATLNGIVRPSDLGIRGALVAHTMPPAYLVAAMSISRTTTDSARIAGALMGAGLFAAFGMASSYAVISCFYFAGVLLTLCVTTPAAADQATDGAMPAPARPSPWRDLREGIVYVWSQPQLLAAIWLAFLVNLSAYPVTNGLLPYVAKEIYRTDQAGLSYLLVSFAAGALVGSIALSLLNARMRLSLTRIMIVCAILWYVALLVFGHVTTLAVGIVWLVLAGIAQSLCMVALAVVLLRDSDERYRGRLMGVRMLAIYSLPVGLLAAGGVIEYIGFAATTSLFSVIGIVFTLVIAVYWHDHVWRKTAA